MVLEQTHINPSTTKLASRIRPTAPTSNAKADGVTFYNGAYHQGYYPGLGPPPGILSEQPITRPAPKPPAPKASKSPAPKAPASKPLTRLTSKIPSKPAGTGIWYNGTYYPGPGETKQKRPAIHAAGSSMAKKRKTMNPSTTTLPVDPSIDNKQLL